jgi:Rieske Fe-S protein
LLGQRNWRHETARIPAYFTIFIIGCMLPGCYNRGTSGGGGQTEGSGSRALPSAGPGEIRDLAEIAANEGGVLRRGLRKIAAYRDERGALHERSAVCPHLGCIVAWNSVEKTWDCPCYGSRFDCHGKVINGPANCDLEAAGN